MYTAIIIAIALFLCVLCIYIIRTWLDYKKNPRKVREFVKNNFNHDIKQEIEPSPAKRFAPKNNRRTTRGRRWQYIDSDMLNEGKRKVYHYAHV